MSRRPARALALVSILAAGVAQGALDGPTPPSPVIYPIQSVPLSFDHAQHLAMKGTSCLGCHDRAGASTRAAEVLIPDEASCAGGGCHTIDRAHPDAACRRCHTAGPAARVIVPPPNLKFNHKVHVARGATCQSCHGDLAAQKVGLATRLQLPKMSTCLGCHDGARAPAACTTCHVSTQDGMVRTDFPEGRLVPTGQLRGDAHDLTFEKSHGRVAEGDARYCKSCHTQRWCNDCHDGVIKPLGFHGNDYAALHAVDARRAATRCGSCHRLQTFCTGCHARSGVGDDPRTSAYQRLSQATPEMPAQRRFHPDGWWSTNTPNQRAGTHHGFQAQRNIQQCASCHREDFCTDCHARQVNPHPGDWLRSPRCKALLARAGRMCLRCHLRAEDARCE